MTGEEYEREKNKARCRQYYQNHYEELREKWRIRNQTPERKAKRASWRKANPEKNKEYQRRYREAHREELRTKAREYQRAKRAAQKEEVTVP